MTIFLATYLSSSLESTYLCTAYQQIQFYLHKTTFIKDQKEYGDTFPFMRICVIMLWFSAFWSFFCIMSDDAKIEPIRFLLVFFQSHKFDEFLWPAFRIKMEQERNYYKKKVERIQCSIINEHGTSPKKMHTDQRTNQNLKHLRCSCLCSLESKEGPNTSWKSMLIVTQFFFSLKSATKIPFSEWKRTNEAGDTGWKRKRTIMDKNVQYNGYTEQKFLFSFHNKRYFVQKKWRKIRSNHHLSYLCSEKKTKKNNKTTR